MKMLIVGHGNYATGLLSAAEMLGMASDATAALDFTPDIAPAELGARISAQIDGGGPALICCDLLGGTPYNQAVAVTRGCVGMQVIAGVNLAMVLEAASQLDDAESPRELADAMLAAMPMSVRVFDDAASGTSGIIDEEEEL